MSILTVELEYKNMDQICNYSLIQLGNLVEQTGTRLNKLQELKKTLKNCQTFYMEGENKKKQKIEILLRQLKVEQLLMVSVSIEEAAEGDGEEVERQWNHLLQWNNNTIMYKHKGDHSHSQMLLNYNNNNVTNATDFIFVDHVQSIYQNLQVYDSQVFGRVLLIDDQIQISNQLDDNYTVDLAGLAIQNNTVYQNVLVIGGGDMLIPSYLLNNHNVQKLTVCELDQEVTNQVRKHFSMGQNIETNLATGRLKLVFQDGSIFVVDQLNNNNNNNNIDDNEYNKYDGIVIDNSDVDYINSPAACLFTVEFFKNIKGLLRKGGSFSQQVTDETVKTIWLQRVKEAGFTHTKVINSITPEYSIQLPLAVATNL